MDTITPHAFLNPGGKEKAYDSNDIKLGSAVAKVYTHPKVLTNAEAWAMAIEYQAQQPACGAHSGAELKDLALGARFTPQATWGDIKTFDGFAIEDGTDIRSVFKSITKTGVLDFAEMGNHVELSLADYAYSPNAAHRAMMAQKSGMGYGFITDLTFEGLKQFISDHGPTMILMRVNAQFWTAPNGVSSWQEKDILPLRPPTAQYPNQSGHFVVCHSFDENNIYFVNHWSDGWGRKGHGYFGANYMSQIIDAGALFPLGFTKDLFLGMTDVDVTNLQHYLNTHGHPVAAAGHPGSAGMETDYFGPATQVALKALQIAAGIKPVSGYFGPLTRAYVQTHP